MKSCNLQKAIFFCFLFSSMSSCDIFNNDGKEIYSKGRYTIRKKNLMSYYLASPNLFVKTEKGEVKINLNTGAKNRMPQEKISSIEINEINNDSIQIHFISKDTSLNSIKSQIIYLNVKLTVDSILSRK